MSLPPLQLDDLRWREMVEAVRGRIMAASGSQWTLHAAVDPGVTLLELYAHLLEQRLYWLDQVPDELLRAILHLLGEAPRPALPATTLLAVEASTDGSVLAEGRELLLSSGKAVHILSTRAALTPLPVREIHLDRGDGAERIDRPVSPWHALFEDLGEPGEVTLELRLGRNLLPIEADATLSLLLDLETPAANTPQWIREAVEVPPPATLIWSYSSGPGGFADLASNRLDDGSGGLRRSGLLRLQIPADWTPLRLAPDGQPIYALRVRTESADFSAPPRLRRVLANTVAAWQHSSAELPAQAAVTQIGKWLPLPKQTLVLPADLGLPIEDSLKLRLEDRDGVEQGWQRVDDFTRAGPADRVFTLDRTTRTLTFGDGLNGRIPRTGNPASLSLTYLTGGGASGNLGPGSSWQGWIDPDTRLQPVIARNPVAASGGAEPETPSEAVRRVAADLHRRKRAVTAADFVELAESTPGVAIARAHAAPGYHPGFPCSEVPGALTLFLVPEVPREEAPAHWVAAPYVDPGALAAVRAYLDARRLAGTELFVLPAPYRAVRLQMRLEAAPGATDASALEPLLRATLQRFLDPLRGGAKGDGWPFGEPLRPSALAGAVRADLPEGIDPIETRVGLDANAPLEACADTEIRAHELVWLHELRIHVQSAETLFAGGLR